MNTKAWRPSQLADWAGWASNQVKRLTSLSHQPVTAARILTPPSPLALTGFLPNLFLRLALFLIYFLLPTISFCLPNRSWSLFIPNHDLRLHAPLHSAAHSCNSFLHLKTSRSQNVKDRRRRPDQVPGRLHWQHHQRPSKLDPPASSSTIPTLTSAQPDFTAVAKELSIVSKGAA